MADYRRFYIPNSTWFFTVNLAEGQYNHLLVEKIDLLRAPLLVMSKTEDPFV